MPSTSKSATFGGRRPQRQATGYYVSRSGNGWVVREAKTEKRIGRYASEQSATDAAGRLVRRNGGELTVYGPAGRTRRSFTLGEKALEAVAPWHGCS